MKHLLCLSLFLAASADLGFDLDIDDDMVEVAVDAEGNAHEAGKAQIGPDGSISVTFINEHNLPVDVYWDDKKFGVAVAHRLEQGQSTQIKTFLGHIFTWTEHGTTRPLSPPQIISETSGVITLTTNVVEDAKKTMKCADRFPTFCEETSRGRGCQEAPGWMIVHCPKSCNQCDMQDPKVRCKRSSLKMNQEPTWKPGDLNNLFQDILKNFPQYKPKALSSPPGPWVLQFEDFIKPEEAARLIALNSKSLERSTDQGNVNEYGEMQKVISQSRTSSNSWCQGECENDPLVSALYNRIAQVTRVPRENYESFQVLQYQKDQFYRTHHDDSGGDHDPSGPRIMTFFLYLSDVEEGGETDFPNIKVRAKPKAGRAILWPSMRDDNPIQSDQRMYHQAMPVIKGTKYAANAWIHLYNYKVPNLWGCTGSFN